MIKKRLPRNVAWEDVDMFALIQNVLGNVPISLNANGLLIIDANPTSEQLQQLKNDFLNEVEAISEL
jgi:hypothetical protein